MREGDKGARLSCFQNRSRDASGDVYIGAANRPSMLYMTGTCLSCPTANY